MSWTILEYTTCSLNFLADISKISSSVKFWVCNSGNFLYIPFIPRPYTPGILSELSPNNVLYKIKFLDKHTNFSVTTLGV